MNESPFGAPPGEEDPAAMRERLRSIAEREARQWRVAEDAVDAAIDKWVDKAIQDGEPRPFAWLRRVFLNLCRSGPERRELEVRSCGPLQDADPESTAPDPQDPESRPALRGLIRSKRSLLTDAEYRAVEALLEADSLAAAAGQAGMSRRDFRNRIKRAAHKLSE